jgi:hypothetical protein
MDDGSVPPPESLGATGAPWGTAEAVPGISADALAGAPGSV